MLYEVITNRMKYRNSIAAGTALMAVLAAFTANFESGGAKPHLTAYLDQGGVATICHGITGPDIKLGMTVTEEWCQKRYERELERHSKPLDKVRITSYNVCYTKLLRIASG